MTFVQCDISVAFRITFNSAQCRFWGAIPNLHILTCATEGRGGRGGLEPLQGQFPEKSNLINCSEYLSYFHSGQPESKTWSKLTGRFFVCALENFVCALLLSYHLIFKTNMEWNIAKKFCQNFISPRKKQTVLNFVIIYSYALHWISTPELDLIQEVEAGYKDLVPKAVPGLNTNLKSEPCSQWTSEPEILHREGPQNTRSLSQCFLEHRLHQYS